MLRPSPSAAPGRLLRAALLVGCCAAALAVAPAAADGPTGGNVARGSATISGGEGRTTIRQSSNRAVIDWQGFDVGRDHSVIFDQPGRSSATLNRVAPSGRSVIQGAIEAPGTVIIQNTAGVIFSGSARVDVGGMVATSQRVDAERFQNTGRLRIGGGEAPGAAVVNDGRITVGNAGLAALVGGNVENAGAIVARRGSVVLASGRTTTLDFAGDGVMQLAVDGDAETTRRGVRHSGTIDAPDGQVVITAGAASRALDAAINTTGAIRANGIAGEGGRIEITGRGAGAVRIAGTLEATGPGRGGDITATGATVELAAPARINASGGSDGGRVRLGGDWQGQGPLRRAEHLTMANGAQIVVDGLAGRGGEVVLWSDGTTLVDGAISATGAVSGGRVETSGAFALGVGEGAEVALGTGGLWLLDPRDVRIGIGGFNQPLSVPFEPPAGNTVYNVARSRIVNTLNAGSDVIITTVQPASTMPGDIIFDAPIVNWTGAGNLRFEADRDILMNASMDIQGPGSFTAVAARDIAVNSPITIDPDGTGTIALDAGRSILVNEDVQSLGSGGLRFAAAEDVVIGGGGGNRRVSTASGPLEIEAGGTVDLAGPVSAASVLIESAERVGLGAAASITASGPGDALVVAAGREFRNDAGAGALSVTDPDARWLLYVDSFDGMVGPEPGPREFTLYGRPYADNLPPTLAGFEGNRIVYGETPVLTITGETLEKPYGTEAIPGFTLEGLRPGDEETAFDDGPGVASDGAPADADVGVYATEVSATPSVQGYVFELVDGELTVTPVPLTVTAEDASRPEGAPNPPFTATFEGFVLEQTEAVLGGTLAFATPATAASPPGAYAITPSGLTSQNYDISFVDGTLTVEPAPPPPPPTGGGDPLPGVLASLEIIAPGAPPFTPGDAAFRTTLAEVPTSRDTTFALTYSLGEVVQLAPAEAGAAGGFVPAAGGLADAAGEAVVCGGPVGLGEPAPAGCVPVAITESFWSTAFPEAAN